MRFDKKRVKNNDRTFFDKVTYGGFAHKALYALTGLFGIYGMLFVLSLFLGE